MSCMVSEKGMDLDTAIRLLENMSEYPLINQPPVKPRGGEIFIYLPDTLEEQENYKCDQYRWLNSGPKEIPRKNPLVKKQYFIGKLPQGKTQAFQKHCYVLINDQRRPHPVLLHYIGDETVMVDYPHGNAKKTNSAYYSIAPSVRKEIAARSESYLPVAIINAYKSTSYVVGEHGERSINPVLTPRNKSQVRNIRRKQRMSTINERMSNDELVTLHSIAGELGGFCKYVRTFRDFMAVVGIDELRDELANVLKLNDNTVVCQLHDAVKVGRYNITAFSFMHCAFEDGLSLPAFFLITETCDFALLEKFLLCIVEMIPALEESLVVVVSNQEYLTTSALAVTMPAALQIYDWEHLFASVRAFMRKQNTDVKVISVYIKQLRMLMNCENVEEYRANIERFSQDWSKEFQQYFFDFISPIIESRLGRWILERFKLYNQHMGLQPLQNTDTRIVLRELQEVKECALDIILPSLYHLQNYHHVNLQHGFGGSGPYSLKSDFSFLRRDADELRIPASVYEPTNIVKIFRVRGITLLSNESEAMDDDSLLLHARRILESGSVSHSPLLSAFLVKSPSGSLHGVQVFPRESCSCSSYQRCAHIMAAMLALGVPIENNKQETSMTASHYVRQATITQHESDMSAVEALQKIASGGDFKMTPSASMTPGDVNMTSGDVNMTSGDVNMTSGVVKMTSEDNIYQQQQEVTQLHTVLNAVQGDEVLMVVTQHDQDKLAYGGEMIDYT